MRASFVSWFVGVYNGVMTCLISSSSNIFIVPVAFFIEKNSSEKKRKRNTSFHFSVVSLTPCFCTMLALVDYGIYKVLYHSSDDGTWKVFWYIRQMPIQRTVEIQYTWVASIGKKTKIIRELVSR